MSHSLNEHKGTFTRCVISIQDSYLIDIIYRYRHFASKEWCATISHLTLIFLSLESKVMMNGTLFATAVSYHGRERREGAILSQTL